MQRVPQPISFFQAGGGGAKGSGNVTKLPHGTREDFRNEGSELSDATVRLFGRSTFLRERCASCTYARTCAHIQAVPHALWCFLQNTSETRTNSGMGLITRFSWGLTKDRPTGGLQMRNYKKKGKKLLNSVARKPHSTGHCRRSAWNCSVTVNTSQLVQAPTAIR
jgi:hypothetical protein